MKQTPTRSRALRVPLALAAVLLLLWVVELLWAPHYKPVFPWHSVPGYMAFIGLAGCALLTVVAKFGGKKYLQRPAEPERRADADDSVFEDTHDRS